MLPGRKTFFSSNFANIRPCSACIVRYKTWDEIEKSHIPSSVNDHFDANTVIKICISFERNDAAMKSILLYKERK